jgi:hypothetical protein
MQIKQFEDKNRPAVYTKIFSGGCSAEQERVYDLSEAVKTFKK